MTRTIALIGSGNDGKTTFLQRYTLVRNEGEGRSIRQFRDQALVFLEANTVHTIPPNTHVDVVLLFHAADQPITSHESVQAIANVQAQCSGVKCLCVVSKADLLPAGANREGVYLVQPLTGEGCDELLEAALRE